MSPTFHGLLGEVDFLTATSIAALQRTRKGAELISDHMDREKRPVEE